MGDCKTSDCEADNSDYTLNTNAGNHCCYALADKTREFLHSDTYILDYIPRRTPARPHRRRSSGPRRDRR